MGESILLGYVIDMFYIVCAISLSLNRILGQIPPFVYNEIQNHSARILRT